MGMIFNLNGRLVTEEEARISPLDRGFLYGDGIYETVLIRNGRPYQLAKHLQRLKQSAAVIRIDVPWSDPEIEEEIQRVINANDLAGAALRINMSRGVGDWRLSTNGASSPTLLLSLFPIPEYPPDTYTRGWEIIISKDVVTMDPVIPAVAKTTNRLGLILAKQEAEARGAREAILLNQDGYLTEGTSSNLFFVKDRRVCTPALESGILEGVTRGVVMEILRGIDYRVEESLHRPTDLEVADEAFLTFTTAGIVPICRVDDRPIGQETAGPITRKVIEHYNRDVDDWTSQDIGSGEA